MKPGPVGGRIVIVGVGNVYRGDDGVGHAVVRRLREGLRRDREIDIVTQDGEGTRLMETWLHADTTILIDAMQSGAPPGTMRRLNAAKQPLPDVGWRCSTHAFGVAEAIALSGALEQLPLYFIVYGIEGERFAPGTELSAAVAKSIPEVVGHVLHDLERIRVLLEDTSDA